jgi:hypothetical protein
MLRVIRPASDMVGAQFASRVPSAPHSRRAAGDDTGACRYPETSVRLCVHLTFHVRGGCLFREAERVVLRSSPEYTGTSAQAGGE